MALWVWVSMWAAQERKIKTAAAQELHWGQAKARKQPDLRAAGSHSTAADTPDKHRGRKGKKWKSKNTIPKPKWTNWVSHKASYKVKLSVKVTPSPELSCGSYFAHLQSLVMVTVSEKLPSSSSADVSRCTGTEELQRGARGPAHSKCMAVPPFSASTKKGLGHDRRASGLVFNISVYQQEKLNWKKKSLTSV